MRTKRDEMIETLLADILEELERLDREMNPSPVSDRLGALMMQAHNLEACHCEGETLISDDALRDSYREYRKKEREARDRVRRIKK